MNYKYLKIVSVCLYVVTSQLATSYAHADSNQLKAMKWVKRITQSDIDNIELNRFAENPTKNLF